MFLDQKLPQLLPGCTSFIALVGSAFDVIRFAAFSLEVSIKSALENDPLLLCFLLLVKLNIDFARGLRCSDPSAMASGSGVVELCWIAKENRTSQR
jgi:hypothetical protein